VPRLADLVARPSPERTETDDHQRERQQSDPPRRRGYRIASYPPNVRLTGSGSLNRRKACHLRNGLSSRGRCCRRPSCPLARAAARGVVAAR
jgi:hypothetical protein